MKVAIIGAGPALESFSSKSKLDRFLIHRMTIMARFYFDQCEFIKEALSVSHKIAERVLL